MALDIRNRYRHTIFYIGLRQAATVGVLLLIIQLPVCLFLFSLPLTQSLLLSLLTALLAAVISYVTTTTLQKRRTERVDRIIRNIGRKQFEETGAEYSGHRDELDILITRAIRTSKTIEHEIQRLNKIENYRKEFIGDISHELKTPIFAIQGFVETLLNGALEDRQVNRLFLNKAMRHVTRLTYLTKDLMEISRLETGELKSSIQSLNLYLTIIDVVESLQHKAQKDSVDLRVGSFDRDLQVQADRNQIRQVLVNLIENGMKYNRPNGFVEIGVTNGTPHPDRVEVFVRDSGIGIAKSDIKRVTERFFRVDKSRSREKGGTGLGLAIVKHIIESHGEELHIDSEVDRGSTFRFTLSLAGSRPPADHPLDPG